MGNDWDWRVPKEEPKAVQISKVGVTYSLEVVVSNGPKAEEEVHRIQEAAKPDCSEGQGS
jgi:hypothetical protein